MLRNTTSAFTHISMAVEMIHFGFVSHSTSSCVSLPYRIMCGWCCLIHEELTVASIDYGLLSLRFRHFFRCSNRTGVSSSLFTFCHHEVIIFAESAPRVNAGCVRLKFLTAAGAEGGIEIHFRVRRRLEDGPPGILGDSSPERNM